MNGVIIQFFHWYHPGNLWNEFIQKADYLKDTGFTVVWFPPAVKCASGIAGRGYDVYDLYDLGEFHQKGGVPTRYGSKAEYLQAIETAHQKGIAVYADVVLNHRMGGDEEEKISVHQVSDENRNEKISETLQVTAFTKFTFPDRAGKYSEFIWDHQCFSGIDRVTKDEKKMKGIFKIHNDCGKHWNKHVSHQFGNYDYLMGADVEFRNLSVVEEMKHWIQWYFQTTKVDGIRLDALKHISSEFLKDFIHYIKTDVDPGCCILGEFWKNDSYKIEDFSDDIKDQISCFDVPLHFNFFKASEEGCNYDLRKIFKGSLLENRSVFSVCFVENHDTQPLQALESSVKDWFKPIAYSMILLTERAYPCVFYPDLFGAEYTDLVDGIEKHIVINKVDLLPKLMKARQLFAYGSQIDFFDHPNCIAFMRTGDGQNQGCVVVISNIEEADSKVVDLGEAFSNAVFYDFLELRTEETVSDQYGKTVFKVNPCSVSVWVKK